MLRCLVGTHSKRKHYQTDAEASLCRVWYLVQTVIKQHSQGWRQPFLSSPLHQRFQHCWRERPPCRLSSPLRRNKLQENQEVTHKISSNRSNVRWCHIVLPVICFVFLTSHWRNKHALAPYIKLSSSLVFLPVVALISRIATCKGSKDRRMSHTLTYMHLLQPLTSYSQSGVHHCQHSLCHSMELGIREENHSKRSKFGFSKLHMTSCNSCRFRSCQNGWQWQTGHWKWGRRSNVTLFACLTHQIETAVSWRRSCAWEAVVLTCLFPLRSVG